MARAKKQTKNPLVSVILPVYNAEKYIDAAVESISKQTYKRLEIIIIDDRSLDSSWQLLKKWAKADKRIILLRNKKNLKLSHTLNAGITQAKGEYIARMDADDWSYPDRIEKQVRFMQKHPGVGIVGGTMEIISEEGKVLGSRSYPLIDKDIRKKMFWFSPYSHPLIMIRKSVLESVGYYNDFFNPAEDYDLYFRIGMKARFANLEDVLLKYRIIEKSMTTGSTRNMEEKTIAIRELYANDKKYHMSVPQRIYNLVHKSSFFIPSSFKMNMFHVIRNTIR